ncbi:MAG: DMT family transporter [Hyphomicrobiaceae bacterium]|nr:DMT family transporter [Hyphomicrobiaceae bacterium]
MTTRAQLETARRPDRHHLKGCLVVVLAGFVLSLGAFTIRLADGAGPWQYTTWRSLAFAGAMWIVAGLGDGRNQLAQLAQLRPIAWIGALMLALAATTFIAAIKVTTLAETFFLCSLAPLIAAVLAKPILGERITATSLLTIVLGVLGVLVMIEGRLDGGNWTGRALALLSALGFAGYSLAARGSLPRDLNATLLAFGIVAAFVGLGMTMALGEPLAPPAWDIGMAALHGAIVLSLGLFLYAQGSRFVSAVTLTVLAQTEAVLAPLWGFLYFAERPSAGIVAGGGIILAAVILQAVLGARPEARK